MFCHSRETKSRSINTLNSTWKVSLQNLDLSENELTKLHLYTFYGLSDLSSLDLRRNKDLTSIQIASFSALKNLRSLDVSFTNLKVFIFCAPVLRSLKFQTSTYYSDAIIPGETFNEMQTLEKLEIINSLSTFNLHYNRSSLFDGLKNLKNLLLSRNHFDGFPSHVFSQLTYLEELDLSGCQIKVFKTNAFAGLTSLLILNLTDNNIQRLPVLNELHHLTDLYLDNNELSYINSNAFVNTSKLSHLALSNNFFTGFNHSSFSPVFSVLISVDISGNRLECNCQAKWLVDWLLGPVTF